MVDEIVRLLTTATEEPFNLVYIHQKCVDVFVVLEEFYINQPKKTPEWQDLIKQVRTRLKKIGEKQTIMEKIRLKKMEYSPVFDECGSIREVYVMKSADVLRNTIKKMILNNSGIRNFVAHQIMNKTKLEDGFVHSSLFIVWVTFRKDEFPASNIDCLFFSLCLMFAFQTIFASGIGFRRLHCGAF